MEKNGYISTASKYFAVSSVILLVSNILTLLGAWVPYADTLAKKTSGILLIVITVMMYVAFNGEGVGYRRSLQRRAKKITGLFKLLIVFNIAFYYAKNKAVESVALSGEVNKKLLLSLVTAAMSFSFVLMLVALRNLVRDKNNKPLLLVDASAFSVSVVYFVFKLIRYSVSYGAFSVGGAFGAVLVSQTVMELICILQYVADIFMFIATARMYRTTASQVDSPTSAFPTRNAYNTDLVGTDTLEDDWLLNSQSEQ